MRIRHMNTDEKGKLNMGRIMFLTELIAAIILAVSCALIGMSNLLPASNNLYPNSSEIMGHMTKVLYISDQLSQGHLSGWFPYWYNGSAITQYDSPLSYYLMVPVYWISGNVMLTYKIFCVSIMTIGGLGIWTFCYKKIGRYCGLTGIAAFCLQPLLLSTFYGEGYITYGVIIAVLPWFLLSVLSCADCSMRGRFIGSTLTTVLMILSHALLTYMVCFTTVLSLLMLIVLKKLKIRYFTITLISIILAWLITAFWSLIGLSGLENPGVRVPYPMPETVLSKTAKLQWFLPESGTILYFSIVVSVLWAISLICYLIGAMIKKNKDIHKFYGMACIILSAISVIFSFGRKLPIFRFVPYSDRIETGSILICASATGAITVAFGIYSLWNFHRLKLLLRIITLVIIAALCIDLNPAGTVYQTMSSDSDTVKSIPGDTENAFDQGRYLWYGVPDGQEAFFSYMKNISLSKGVDQENTLYYKDIYNMDIAIPLKEYDYFHKSISFWNVKSILLSDEFYDLGNSLIEQLGFVQTVGDRSGFTLYTDNQPSSYYYVDKRNALVLNSPLQGFSIHFPEFVQGKSRDLWDYSEEELMGYKLIYIIEPDIKTRTQKDEFERIVTKLVNKGIHVLIEPVSSNTFDLFNVHAEDNLNESSPELKAAPESPIDFENAIIKDNSNIPAVRSLNGLDEVYADFIWEDGNLKNAVIGSREVGNGEVIFIGAHLSEYLEAVYSHIYGLYTINDVVRSNGSYIETVYSQIFSYLGMNNEFLPEVFDGVTKQQWDYKGGSFTYTGEESQEITVSVTYTPRWKAFLDGEEIGIGQRENLIILDLPAGKHTVELVYGITFYGIIGYVISATGILALGIILLTWKWNMKLISSLSSRLNIYLQITDPTKPVPVIFKDSILKQTAVAKETADSPDNYQEKLIQLEEVRTDRDMKEYPSEKTGAYGTFIIDGEIHQESITENGVKIDIIEIKEDNVTEESNEETNVLTINDTQIRDIKINDIEIYDLETNDMEINNKEIRDIENSNIETKDIETKDIETKDIETKDIEAKDIEANKIETNDKEMKSQESSGKETAIRGITEKEESYQESVGENIDYDVYEEILRLAILENGRKLAEADQASIIPANIESASAKNTSENRSHMKPISLNQASTKPVALNPVSVKSIALDPVIKNTVSNKPAHRKPVLKEYPQKKISTKSADQLVERMFLKELSPKEIQKKKRNAALRASKMKKGR